LIFNSYEFIFGFLPIVLTVYYFIKKSNNHSFISWWLICASLFFYGFWNEYYLLLITLSIFINYLLGTTLIRLNGSISLRKMILSAGILFNVLLLGYYKYYDFFIGIFNQLFSTTLPILDIALPLAISFFTFQQIAYLVDSYRGETREYSFREYILFVLFFPQLIAGPIVHHKEMIPQFRNNTTGINFENISKGIHIFSIGLFKKVILADTFSTWASAGFSNSSDLSFAESWITSLAYTLQLYFDFSGYTDMAIGAALLFNIHLPVNFLSPYKSVDIQDFWRRWHITLSRFFTHYLYIPLGGSRISTMRTYMNIFIIFFVSGIWHGAGWTFIVWGVMHGVASMINRFWKGFGRPLPRWIAWFVTFQFVNAAWVFFRAESIQDAVSILKTMFIIPNLSTLSISWDALFTLPIITLAGSSLWKLALFLIGGMFLVLFTKNSIERIEKMNLSWKLAFFTAFLLIVSILNMTSVSEFLYFNF
jgi:alginate O-acetyltransferase complex protein AlgI